jgi:hypothetical protein
MSIEECVSDEDFAGRLDLLHLACFPSSAELLLGRPPGLGLPPDLGPQSHTLGGRGGDEEYRTVSSPPRTRLTSQRRLVQVQMKYRTAKDPTAEELLGQLLQDSGCAWLCQEVFGGRRPHLAWLPGDIAPLLSENIQPALESWRARASCLASGAMRRAPDLKFCV